jgi:lipoate-protein ligase A
MRVVTLKELLGHRSPGAETVKNALLDGFQRRLGITAFTAAPSEHEETLASRFHDAEIGTDAFVYEIDDPGAGDGVRSATHIGPGGTVRAYVRLEGPHQDRVREALITGDFFVTPPRTIFDLEATLRGVRADEIGCVVERFFASTQVGLLSLRPTDLAAVLEAAVQQPD